MTIVEIFKQLKEARLAANRTLRDVSKACGVAEPTLSMAERGERDGMRGHNLVRWAAALGLELTLTPAGPGSTSPEPGPACKLADWCVVTGPHDASRCATSPESGSEPTLADEVAVHQQRLRDRWRVRAESTSPEPGPPLPWPDFNPAVRVTRCGQSSAHGPHFMDHGPDQPRNCPGTGEAAWDAYQRWATEYERAAESTKDGTGDE